MKYIEAISRNWILSLIPTEGLDDNARTTIVLNQVAYDSAIAAFEEEQAEVVKKLKPEGFDEKMQRFALALGVREATTDEERKKAEELKEDPEFPAFKERYDEVDRRAVEARRKALDTRELEVCEYPLRDALPAISRVLPVGVKRTMRRLDGAQFEADNQEIFTWVAAIALKQK